MTDQTKTQDEQKTTERLYDVFDEIVEASQDPEHHPVFEQLRQSVKSEFRKSCDRAIGIVNLAFSDEVIAASNPSLNAMLDRMERGETTFEEEDARLLSEWRILKEKIKNNKNQYEKDKSDSCFRILKIPIVLHTDDGVHFGVTVPDVAGCFSAGDSFDDALENVQEALVLHFESMRIDGDSLPCINSIEHHKNNPDYRDGVWAYVDFEF